MSKSKNIVAKEMIMMIIKMANIDRMVNPGRQGFRCICKH